VLSKVTVTSCRYYIKMFDVSALLQDDALKPATPLTNGAINENQLIFDEVKAHKNGAIFGPPRTATGPGDSVRCVTLKFDHLHCVVSTCTDSLLLFK